MVNTVTHMITYEYCECSSVDWFDWFISVEKLCKASNLIFPMTKVRHLFWSISFIRKISLAFVWKTVSSNLVSSTLCAGIRKLSSFVRIYPDQKLVREVMHVEWWPPLKITWMLKRAMVTKYPQNYDKEGIISIFRLCYCDFLVGKMFNRPQY